ncbi:LEA type 2 family protein [Ideonella azotifigens]|uniref:LEA type 2 family protein n=1 Tax=Ideonella azotifigens TaxID=513160 RepID=A0ABN1K8T0_9BURK|nr:LEA type 2 family protein [Ideonella azotifigens]MCD2342827.1 LEA type 2 family protein [Ideonella azotifigens]
MQSMLPLSSPSSRRSLLAGFAASALAAATLLSGCAGMGKLEKIKVTVASVESLGVHGLEARFVVKLRVQNPNDISLDYDGLAVDMELNGKPLASGVSNDKGTLPRFGETVVTLPLTVSTVALLRQASELVRDKGGQKEVPYLIKGKIGGGLFGTVEFHQAGVLAIPRL